MKYIEIAQGSPKNRGVIIPLIDLKKYLKAETELYRSYYTFDDKILEHRKLYKTASGYDGTMWLDAITIDIDKGKSSDEEVLYRTQVFVQRIEEDWGLDRNEIMIWFSGRGYHITFPDIFRFEPSSYIAEEVKTTLTKYFPEMDSMPLMKTGLIRVGFSYNAKTHLYKTPLSARELFSLRPEEIATLASKFGMRKVERDVISSVPDFSHLKIIKASKKKEEEQRGESTKIVTCAQVMFDQGAIAQEGQRHKILINMVGSWRMAGMSYNATMILAKAWNQDSLSEYELEKQVKYIWDKGYSPGCNDETRIKFCDPKCVYFKDKSYVMEVMDSKTMEESFESFMRKDYSTTSFDLNEIYKLKAPYRIYPGEHIIILGETKLGKGLRLNEMLPTPQGWKQAGDIKVGDELFTEEGIPTKVRLVSEIHNRDNFEVIFKDGTSLITDDQHLWAVNYTTGHDKKYRKDIIISTKELYDKGVMLKYRSKYRVRMNDAVVYAEKQLLVDPYLFGCWLGDGDKNGGRLTSSFEDLKHYQKEFQIDSWRRDNRRETTVSYRVCGLKVKLRELGVLGNKYIPDIYLQGSIQQRIDLLCGLMDTDGSAEKFNFFYNTNLTLINNVCELLSSLGIKYTKKEKESVFNGRKYRLCYRIGFRASFAPFRLKRKINNSIQRIEKERGSWRYIREVRKIESQPTVCFQVSSVNELFLAGRDYIVTHNTALAQNICVKLNRMRILYLSLEVNERLLFRRFVQIAYGMTKEAVMEHYANQGESLTDKIDHIQVMTVAPELDRIKLLIKRYRPQIVVVDTMDGIQVAKYKDGNSKTEQLGNELKRIAQETDTIIISVHHIAKSQSANERGEPKDLTIHSGKGSSAVEQKADRIIAVEGSLQTKTRLVRSLGTRDDESFAIQLQFHADTTFEMEQLI